jgi:hypothetical protein
MGLTAQQTIEIRLRRQNLASYIAADSVQISLTRYTRVDDGAGGWVKGPSTTLAPQTMRLVPYKRRLSSLTDMVTAGEIPNVEYSLIANYNADVERYDEFDLNGEAMKVLGVEPKSKIPAMSDRLTILIEIRDRAY